MRVRLRYILEGGILAPLGGLQTRTRRVSRGREGPETTPIILGRRLGALLRRLGGGRAPN